MPLVGLICPDNTRIDIESCLTKCNDRCTPYPVAYRIIDDIINGFHQGSILTVTSLIGCLRCTYLERTTDFHSRYSNLWYSSRGTWMHATLESIRYDPRWLVEKRLYSKFNNIELSGQIDAHYIPDALLLDYKSIKDDGLLYVKKNGPKPDHIKQVSTYKCMLEDEGYKVKHVSIVYMAMAGFYECKNVFTLDRSSVTELVELSAPILINAFETGVVPPIPNPRPVWLCNEYCDVLDTCEALIRNAA
jgi:hypothetical protein